MAIAPSPIYEEIYQFLVSSPTAEAIIAFRASDAAQARVRHLLDASREQRLTLAEQHELDEFEQANHLVAMLKIYARQKIARS